MSSRSARHLRESRGIDSQGRPAYSIPQWSRVPVVVQRSRQQQTGRTPVDVGLAPTLASLTPDTAAVGELPVTVTLTGTNFDAYCQVLGFGQYIPFTLVSATSITVTAPAGMTAGAKDVLVVGRDGRTSVTRVFTVT